MNHLGHGCIGWNRQSIVEIAQEIAPLGYEAIEGFGLEELHPDDQDLAGKLQDLGLRYGGTYLGASLCERGKVEGELKEFSRVARITKDLGGDRIVSGAGHCDFSEYWELFVENVQLLGKICGDCGLHLDFHPHLGTMVSSVEEVDRLMEGTDPALVSLCFDTGHILAGGGDVTDFVKKYFERIRSVHVKDYDTSRREFVGIGEGDVDFCSLIPLLSERGYAGDFIVELDWCDDMVAHAIRAAAYLAEMTEL